MLAVILNAGIIVRGFIIYHDGIHLSFYRRNEANERLATILQAWIITPVDLWRQNSQFQAAPASPRRNSSPLEALLSLG